MIDSRVNKKMHAKKYLLAKLQAPFFNKTRGNFIVIGGESTNKERKKIRIVILTHNTPKIS